MSEVKGQVSVTIPFCNAERFLPETIESVLAQTYTSWELLLVNDGCTDRSAEIARRYEAQSPGKIRVLEHPGRRNCGVTRSRNLGAHESNGEFFAFLDADDLWLPRKLEEQVALLRANPEAGLVYGPSEYWYDWDVERTLNQENCVVPVAPGGKLYSPSVLLTTSHPLGKYGAPCPCSFLLRRSAFDRVGGFVESFNPDTYQLYEDTAFLTKIYLNVPVFIGESCLDRYRCVPSSIWHRIKGTNREELERRFYFRWLRQYMLEQGIVDRQIWRAVRGVGWPYRLPFPPSVTRLMRRIHNKLLRSMRSDSNLGLM